jgi:hypothetical protein
MADGLLNTRAPCFSASCSLDHGVEGVQAGFFLRRGAEPVVGVAGERDVRHQCRHLASGQRQVFLFKGIHRVAAARRLRHHGVSRILVGLEACQRIGKECNFHGRVQSR